MSDVCGLTVEKTPDGRWSIYDPDQEGERLESFRSEDGARGFAEGYAMARERFDGD